MTDKYTLLCIISDTSKFSYYDIMDFTFDNDKAYGYVYDDSGVTNVFTLEEVNELKEYYTRKIPNATYLVLPIVI